MKDKQDPPHRGRVQAQNRASARRHKLDESEKWARENPPTKTEGHEYLNALKEKLAKPERELRELVFREAHAFIDRIGPEGAGDDTSKSFYVRGLTDGSRVDIVVHKGIAFITEQ